MTATHFIEYQLWSDRADTSWVRLNNLTSERTSHVGEASRTSTMFVTIYDETGDEFFVAPVQKLKSF